MPTLPPASSKWLLGPWELSRDQKYFNKNWVSIILETLFATAKIGEDLRLEQILSRVGMLRYYYCGKTLASMASKASCERPCLEFFEFVSQMVFLFFMFNFCFVKNHNKQVWYRIFHKIWTNQSFLEQISSFWFFESSPK